MRSRIRASVGRGGIQIPPPMELVVGPMSK